MYKICSRCTKLLHITTFFKDSNNKDGVRSNCKKCNKPYAQKYYIEHKTKLDQNSKQWRKSNKQKMIQYTQKYQQNHPEKIYEYKKKSIEKRRQYAKVYVQKKKATDINFYLAHNLRKRLNFYIKKKPKSTLDYLGCSISELKQHLESKFQPGMTWENYGKYGWHIDHIKPLVAFDLAQESELYIACNYLNLQPLWAKDNHKKGAKSAST